ncbi:hypothetical protein B1812_10870 [Methylocystis bryophila]|uniref:Uncharacterized protein n=1 Tax=Methylocystis bryophila TaxID=655015 RepID=A0A1W6MV68_9HYPH|nr:hypothetical protein B1812_10870 [Methylocystis bryophila]
MYSSRSFKDPNEANIPRPTSCAERPAESTPLRSKRRISMQDYAFALMLADLATIVGSWVLLQYLFLPKSSVSWASPSLIIVSISYLLASIAFKNYSTSTILDRRGAMRSPISALGAAFGLFLIPAETTNIAYSRPHFFLGRSSALSLSSPFVSPCRLTCAIR